MSLLWHDSHKPLTTQQDNTRDTWISDSADVFLKAPANLPTNQQLQASQEHQICGVVQQTYKEYGGSIVFDIWKMFL